MARAAKKGAKATKKAAPARAASKASPKKPAPKKPKPAAKKPAAGKAASKKAVVKAGPQKRGSKATPSKGAKAAAPAKKTPAAKKPAAKKTAAAKKTTAAKTSPKAAAASKPAKKAVGPKAEPPVAEASPVAAKPKAPPPPPPKPEPPKKPRKPEVTPKMIAKIKEGLETQRAQLLREFTDLEEGAFSLSQSDMSGEASFDEEYADAGSFTFEREKELSIGNNIRDLLEKVTHALDRIERGTYGLCENCGDPINKDRLMALPYSSLCISCKQQEERTR